jgi:hypothetical protein
MSGKLENETRKLLKTYFSLENDQNNFKNWLFYSTANSATPNHECLYVTDSPTLFSRSRTSPPRKQPPPKKIT